MWLPSLLLYMGIFVRSQKNLNKSVEIQLFATHLESNPCERTKEFTHIQDIFVKIVNIKVASESGLFYAVMTRRGLIIHAQRSSMQDHRMRYDTICCASYIEPNIIFSTRLLLYIVI
jgi:hypothetical protein